MKRKIEVGRVDTCPGSGGQVSGEWHGLSSVLQLFILLRVFLLNGQVTSLLQTEKVGTEVLFSSTSSHLP